MAEFSRRLLQRTPIMSEFVLVLQLGSVAVLLCLPEGVDPRELSSVSPPEAPGGTMPTPLGKNGRIGSEKAQSSNCLQNTYSKTASGFPSAPSRGAVSKPSQC